MFANIKNRFISVIAPDVPPLPTQPEMMTRTVMNNYHLRMAQQQHLPDKFAYARPPFLQLLTSDELKASADHNVRPIIVPRDINLLPWGTGYAECVNSGKSEWNEDQAAFCRQILSDPSNKHPSIPYTYFGIFDGHAGYGAALAASMQFHHIVHEKLVDCIDVLLPRDDDNTPAQSANGFPHPSHFYRRVSKDELIIGALESAFFHMDALIAQDRDRYRDAGGCTACVALFINGKMFVANAGDSRAVLCLRNGVGAKTTDAAATAATKTDDDAGSSSTDIKDDTLAAADGGKNAYPVPFSFDHTPETERQRLLGIARLKPNFLCKQYAATEYAKRPHAKDLGQRILCRQGTMKGWTYKTLTRDDLRMPVVTGEGKRSRLLGTLGVTRGFGDHDLLAINTGIQIKPFLTPHPDVNFRDLTKIVSIPDENNQDGDYGVLIMATDGLWDVSENEAVARTVFQTLAKYPTERHRYTMVAQELVAKARGKINDSGHWRLADSKAAATVDDISVIVLPVAQYYREHVDWERKCEKAYQERIQREAQQATEAKEQSVITLFNGIATAKVHARDHIDDDDEDDIDEEDEIVVEMNKQKEQAKVEVEDDETNSDGACKVIASEQIEQTAITAAKLEPARIAQDIIDAQLNDAVSALEQTDISTNEEKVLPQLTPDEKANKSKQYQQQQQRSNRNRKDKR